MECSIALIIYVLHMGLIISILLILNTEVNEYYESWVRIYITYLQSVYRMYCSFLISRCPKIEVCNKTENMHNTYSLIIISKCGKKSKKSIYFMIKHMRKSGFYNYLLVISVITLYCRKPPAVVEENLSTKQYNI